MLIDRFLLRVPLQAHHIAQAQGTLDMPAIQATLRQPVAPPVAA